MRHPSSCRCAECQYDAGEMSVEAWREHAGAVCSRLKIAIDERGEWMRKCRALEQKSAIYALSDAFAIIGKYILREARCKCNHGIGASAAHWDNGSACGWCDCERFVVHLPHRG